MQGKSTGIRCDCGGEFLVHHDDITVEAGGEIVSQTWTETRCNRCGMDIADTQRQRKEKVSA